MKIDGKKIASKIKKRLKTKVVKLQLNNIIPHLAIVIIGNNPASLSYIRIKKRVGEEIGVKISIYNFKFLISKQKLISLVDQLNNNKSIHGIIIQRPVPVDINKDKLDRLVMPSKDVDGFYPNSPFPPPVSLAVWRILQWIHKNIGINHNAILYEKYDKSFISWVRKKKILIVGRGETGGKPIASFFKKKSIKFTVAHSKTSNLGKLCLVSNIIIPCVGKANIVRHSMIRPSSAIIGVGLHLENGKLKPDYNEDEIARTAAYYAPVPGGVGPVNVACLFENLIRACGLNN